MSNTTPLEPTNEQMRTARQCAEAILKPTDAQRQHGLELHAGSVVVESYGFMPRASADGEALARALAEGSSDAELRDMGEWTRAERIVQIPRERDEFKQAWAAAGVTCIVANTGMEHPSPAVALKRFAYHMYVADMLRDFMPKAVVPDDIVEAKVRNRHCLYFSCNAVPLPQEWTTPEAELRYIRYFFQMGARMMHLTYNRRNMIGDGCVEESNAGLSDFGRQVVREMNRVGVIVDVAHSGWQTCLDAAKTSGKPMVASHSGAWSVHQHGRNKSDEVLRAIADTGGLVGVCCIPAFLGGTGDITAMLDHIDYLARTIGTDHIAIGTDVTYRSSTTAAEAGKVPSRRKLRDPWRKFWKGAEDHFQPQWRKDEQVLSMAWTNWPMFTVGLVQRGYSDEDIKKIIGENVLRVAKAALR